jgi:iron complex outermembrane receptor protein
VNQAKISLPRPKGVPVCGLAGLLLMLAGPLSADPVARQDVAGLEEIIVSATRIPTGWLKLPLAGSHFDADDIHAGRQALGLDEVLASAPGVFFQNRYNFAQDLRISIRGFGARANFGIRGIKLYADDIPLTMPDGQGNVDSIDLGSAERIEVIRGPVSAVYGASGGGVIQIFTEDGPAEPTLSAKASLGAYDYASGQVKFGGRFGALNTLLNLSTTELQGYRDQSAFEQTLFNSKFRYGFADDSTLTVILNAVDSPQADDPGALTAAEVMANPRQAAPRNVQFNTGESLDQQQIGMAWRKPMSSTTELLLRGYAVRRNLINRLAFDINANGQGGSVDLGRKAAGLGAQWNWSHALGGSRSNRLVMGLDVDDQRDLRERYVNNPGQLGPLTTQQDEDVSARAVYLENALDLADSWTITLGARLDKMEYQVNDRLAGPGGPSGSGQTDFEQFSPMLGLVYSAGETWNWYGNISSAFDPPAIAELANPNGPTGFNQDLDPQEATNYELGLRGFLRPGWQYELAVFHIDVRDEIVPYELTGSGQAFFRNAGRSTHEGLEAALRMELLPGLEAGLSYTFMDMVYDEFTEPNGANHAGNTIPGLPEHQAMIDVAWNHDSGFYAGWDALYVGSLQVNSANTVATDSYLVSNLRLGYRRQHGSWSFEPYAGIYNLFDENYNGNIRVNATFGRYYEPAPERNGYAGVQLAYQF